MRTLALTLAACLAAGTALAQTATPPPAPAAPATPPADAAQATPPGHHHAHHGHHGRRGQGPMIKMEGPGGAEITVRCVEGESTRACADIVLQLVDRMRSLGSDRRRDWDGMHDGMRDRDYRDRGRDRD